MSSVGIARSSQLSGSTAYTASSSSLNSMASAATLVPNPGPVVATANIINQKADASRSLYQICVSLKQRLAQVPGFGEYLDELEQDDFQGDDGGPVESLWRLLRTGFPLLAIYNCLQIQGGTPITVDPNANDSKRAKMAIFKFLEACKKELGIQDTFLITDLLGNDTTGLVKVTNVINAVLDKAEAEGILVKVQPYPEDDSGGVPHTKMSYRDHIVKELVDTERKYVQDLENLHDLKNVLEQKGVIPGDVVHQIFLNINAILDFQRRFLIRVETTNSIPPARQEWGSPFVAYEEPFGIYQPFIANQRKAAQVAQQFFGQIQLARHPVAIDFNTLDGFLLKPMQRLVKYPLLLKDLLKKSEDEGVKADLSTGIEAAERVLKKANEAVDRDLLDEAMEDLISRVDDWKNHRVEQFGRLLLHGVYGVITGKSEREQDYDIYLFESILLCCKEVSPAKTKDKKDKTRSTSSKIKNKNARLHLKGRIFMTNVTDVVAMAKPGNYSVQIWWKGDPGVENFSIKFSNEEKMRKWEKGLDTQRKNNNQQPAASPDMPVEFPWLRDQPGLVNPYKEADDDEDDDPYAGQTAPPFGGPMQSIGGTMSRNASNGSLRSRSATNGGGDASLAGMVRQPPPRFPMPAPGTQLSLQTQMTPLVPSPSQRNMDSYFSPTGESPASSRTSNASTMFGAASSSGYPFPKAGTPQGFEDPHNRYTAPAAPRAPSRDGPSPMNGRNPRGPSMPVMGNNAQSAAQQQRSRSYSTPDIQNQQMRRTPGEQIPAMPRVPPHLHDPNIPRSQSGSPRNDIPIRSNTQSPGVQRERLMQQQQQQQQQMQQQQGGTMSQFPTQPLRQGTPGSSGPGLAPPAAIQTMPIEGRTAAPPVSNSLASQDLPVPTQLKVKVNCDSGNYVTLVVAFNITYQSLIDRIDAKLSRFSSSSIGKGNLRLRYRDEDGDFVTIESDDDIQIAFLEWREGVRNMYSGGVGEIELFCVGES
ncbi:Cdc24 calponin [Zalerion maritima]|uniref:Cdc24 calponin n=1 Tax=Zalerion maritima TaxID=339359 RepID=A0AAD5WPF6_9PEZI|nr:Cdc24 calponin [Zalerion maritima]